MSVQAAGAARDGQSLTLAIALLAFAMFMVVTTEFSVIWLLPALARAFDISLAQAGWFVTAFAIAAALLGPPLTMIASRYEPRRVLVAVALLFAIGNAVAALTTHSSILLAVRIIQGCALPVFVSIAIVSGARLAGAGREGWASARVNQGVVATAVLGVPLAAIAAEQIGWPASFAGLSLLGFVAAALIGLLFPRLTGEAQPPSREAVALLWRPIFLAQLALAGVLFTAMFTAYTYIAPLLSRVGMLDGITVGWMLMLFGLAGIVGNWIAGSVVSPNPVLASAIGAMVLALVMAAISAAGTHLILLAALVGLWGAAHTAAFVFCQVGAMTAGRGAPAFAMSLNISVCNLGIALGALAGGLVVDRFGVGAAAYACAALAIVAATIAGATLALRPRALVSGRVRPSPD
jgi:MFS transporter, DHA1 family, inner membrane transport protein